MYANHNPQGNHTKNFGHLGKNTKDNENGRQNKCSYSKEARRGKKEMKNRKINRIQKMTALKLNM